MRTPFERYNPGLNWRLIVPVVSGTLLAVAAGMLVCALVAVADGEAALAFAAPAAVLVPLGAAGLAGARHLRSIPLRARDGYAAVTLAWLSACVVGAAPFLIEGTFARLVDAVFESFSGFTTTGATLLGVIEDEPQAILLWRSLSHWIGGIGIVVLVVAIAPATGLASQRMFYAETSGVTAERLTPRIADTAKIICAVYAAMTGLGIAAYYIAGMGSWDAIHHALSTVATGGFSNRTQSIGAFDSLAIELVAVVLMWLGGVNFAFYYLVLMRRDRLWPQAAEVRAYFVLTAVPIIMVAATLTLEQNLSAAEALRQASFSIVSVMTSTGFVTVDFDQWHDFARFTLLAVMFIGGCAGSTAGGMKVIRIVLLGKAAAQEVQRHLQPKAVYILRVRGKVYAEDVRRGVLGFACLYMLVFFFSCFVMLATGLDFISAISGAASAINITGPALGSLGATENFSAVSEGGLWFMSALMLIGRLEVFTILVLLTPAFWRPSVA